MIVDGYKFSLHYARNQRERWQCSRRSYFGCVVECPVCGDVANGYHYGVFTCESCKSFFKRSVVQQKTYNCLGTNDCVITTRTRTKCPFCRFQRCKLAGLRDILANRKYLCVICSEEFSGGFYSGIRACKSCKEFFKRSVLYSRRVGYICTGTGTVPCVINKQSRHWCRFCRYNKCVAFDPLTPRYCWSRAGNAIILLGGYRFKKRSKNLNQKHEMHWVCNKCDKGCKARLTTLNDAVIKLYNVHDHDGVRRGK